MKEGSIAQWIGRLKSGEEQALGVLVDRYWAQLTEIAASKVPDNLRRAADEEDIVQQAFWTFYENLKKDQFPKLEDRKDLFALLVLITTHKAANHIEHELAKKRGEGKVRGESALDLIRDNPTPKGGDAPHTRSSVTPEEIAILKETYESYVDDLPEGLQEAAKLYLMGHTQQEMSQITGRSLRSVQRKVALLLQLWQRMGQMELDG